SVPVAASTISKDSYFSPSRMVRMSVRVGAWSSTTRTFFLAIGPWPRWRVPGSVARILSRRRAGCQRSGRPMRALRLGPGVRGPGVVICPGRMVRLIDARYLRDYVVWVWFSDGVAGGVDLVSELEGPLFEPLRDLSVFRLVRFDPELHTIVWPNGADVAPEFLRS